MDGRAETAGVVVRAYLKELRLLALAHRVAGGNLGTIMRALLATWKGILLVAFDLAEASGTSAVARPYDGVRAAEIDASW
jgi:hypothetical protein